MLIDCSYFTTGPRRVLNASLGTMPNSNAEEVNAVIEASIAAYQRPFLCGALGPLVGGWCATYLKLLDKDAAAERDQRLDTMLEMLREPFADYVLFKMLRDSVAQATITGAQRIKNANVAVSPMQQQTTAWNRMVDELKAFKEWSASDECDVPGIEPSHDFLTPVNVFNL